MEEWKEYRLGDVAIIKGGKRLPKGIELISNPNAHPYIRISDMYVNKTMELTSSYRYVDNNTFNKIKNYIVNSGDVILAIVGNTIGLVAVIGKSLNNANLTENCVKIIANKEVNQEYIYYYLTSIYGQNKIKKGIVGAAQPKLPIKNIISITISAPSKELQERITNILSSLDDKIELNRRINENLEQQAQALFKSWFVDFEPFKDEKFVDSIHGMIPEGWEIVETNKFMRISKESINPTKNPNRLYTHYSIPAFDEASLPILQYGNEIKSNKQKVLDNMTLVSKLNPRIKRVWFIDKACENAICSTEFIPYLSLNNSPYFLYCYLNSDIFYDSIMSTVNGATGSHQRFQANDTLKYLFPYNEEVIYKFNVIVSGILKQRSRLIKENQKLSQLRDTLLPRLMSGELRLSEIAI